MAKYYFSLSEASVFSVVGKDATRYLNARTSNNIKELPVGAGCAAAALSPQGRTELYGYFFKMSPDEFRIVIDGGVGDELIPILAKYKVADRVDITRLEALTVIHIKTDEKLAVSGVEIHVSDLPREYTPKSIDIHKFWYPISRGPSMGIDFVVPKSDVADIEQELQAAGYLSLSPQRQLLERIRGRRPTFPAELNADQIFLEANLVNAVSFKKGCYVGQEVLEKVDSHGRLPYTLVSLESIESAPEAPLQTTRVSLADGDEPCGEVVSSVIDPESQRILCFARIKTSAIQSQRAVAIVGRSYRIL